MNRDLISANVAGKLSGFSVQTIIRCCAEGRLRYWRLPGPRQMFRIKPVDLVKMLEEQGVPVPDALTVFIKGAATNAGQDVRDPG